MHAFIYVQSVCKHSIWKHFLCIVHTFCIFMPFLMNTALLLIAHCNKTMSMSVNKEFAYTLHIFGICIYFTFLLTFLYSKFSHCGTNKGPSYKLRIKLGQGRSLQVHYIVGKCKDKDLEKINYHTKLAI